MEFKEFPKIPKTHHAKNENRAPAAERRYIKRRHWLDSIKIASGCVDCKIWGPPEVLGFDHIEGEKKFNIGQSWNQGRVALEEEIAKCEIVCANCHAIRTKKRNGDEPVFVPFPKIPRLSRDVVVTEKIDGTCGTIWIDGEGDVWAGSRTKWLPRGGIVDDNFGFARWVAEHEIELAELGPCVLHGEWWGQGIQRGYGLKEKRFSLFNTHKWSDDSVRPACCHVVPVLYQGAFDTGVIDNVLMLLAETGSYAAPGFARPEGIVIFHTAGNLMFKKTILNDEKPKGDAR